MKTCFTRILSLSTLILFVFCAGALGASVPAAPAQYEAFDILPVPESSFNVWNDGKEYVLQTGEIALSVEKETDEQYTVTVSGTAGKMDRADVDVLYSPDEPITNIICVMMRLPDGATAEDCEMRNMYDELIPSSEDDIYSYEGGDWLWLVLGMHDVDGTITMKTSFITLTCCDKTVVYSFNLQNFVLE